MVCLYLAKNIGKRPNENVNNIKEIKIDNDNDNDNNIMENNIDNELKELKDKNEKINYSLIYKRNRGK